MNKPVRKPYNGSFNANNFNSAWATYPIKDETPIVTEQPIKKGTRFIYPYRFTHGLFGCFEDCRLCALGFFCFPCLTYCLYIDANEGRCSACAQCFFGLTPIGCCISNQSIMRTKFRGTFKLHGNVMEDICISYCLPCCTTIQLYHEMKVQGEHIEYPGSVKMMK